MASIGGPCLHVSDGPAVVSARTLRRVVRAVYMVVVKKQRPKLAALGVHLNRLLLSSKGGNRPALISSLSCRSMDPGAAVVHPLPRGHKWSSSSSGPRAGAATTLVSSLSCRSMDAAAAVHQYRPREVQFSCKSTPPHRRRQADRRRALEQEYRGEAAAVSRLFELMDVQEATTDEDFDDDGDLVDLEEDTAAAAWPGLSAGPAPRQVRITDSPFAARQDVEDDGDRLVDRRADEFITWFHDQLRTQQQCAVAGGARERGGSYYWVR